MDFINNKLVEYLRRWIQEAILPVMIQRQVHSKHVRRRRCGAPTVYRRGRWWDR